MTILSLREYLDDQLGNAKSEGQELIYTCPFCGNRKLSFHLAQDKRYGLWQCWHCHEHGNATGFAMRVQHLSYESAQAELLEYDSFLGDTGRIISPELTPAERLLFQLNNDYVSPFDNADNLNDVKAPTLPPPMIPSGVKYFTANSFVNPTPEELPFVEYCLKRRFYPEDLLSINAGYIVNGFFYAHGYTPRPIHNHLIFFTYNDDGQYVYWNTRAIDNQQPKSLNAPDPKEHSVIGKGDLLFNADVAFKQPSVVVVEGVPDALTIGPSAVATFGKGVSTVQKALLVQKLKPGQPLLLMLDMDASNLMINLAKELKPYHPATYLIHNSTNKDANALGREKVLDLIKRNTIPATTEGYLQFLLQG